MNFKETVVHLLDEALAKNPSLFLIDLEVHDSGKICVTLDGDQGVTLQDCMDVSRAIEHNLNRDEQDFSLEVASSGVGSPLKQIRQFRNNVGRSVYIKTKSGLKQEATLAEANEQSLVITWNTREPKKIGKGKETIVHTLAIPYSDILEAIVTITF
jgi:ribosome maturation factor RimP